MRFRLNIQHSICLQSTASLPDCLRQTLFEARNQSRFDAFLSAAASEPTLGSKPSRTSADKNVLVPARYLFREPKDGNSTTDEHG
jgi:hypothetical protein